MTIFEAYNKTKKELEQAGIEDFVFEAREIIKHITGFMSAQIMTNYNKPLTQFQENNLIAIIKQRKIRYPLQYIMGMWDFYGNKFYVGPGVLVPRADTEVLVEECINFLKEKENPQVADLCAGSGCIGITIAKENPNTAVTMIEKYNEAATYALRNIEYNKVSNAKLIMGDVLEETGSDGQYDLIVSNPPYIPIEEMKTISPETEFEPETALLAKDGGMEFYKSIIKGYKKSLKKGGMMAFEVGIGEYEKVWQLFYGQGFSNITVKKDLNNIERVVFAFI